MLSSIKIADLPWSNIFINLMTMDYGSATPSTCVVVSGSCDMGRSAISAAESLHNV